MNVPVGSAADLLRGALGGAGGLVGKPAGKVGGKNTGQDGGANVMYSLVGVTVVVPVRVGVTDGLAVIRDSV